MEEAIVASSSQTGPVEEYVQLGPNVMASGYALKELSRALGCAQSKYSPSLKTATNQYGGWKYTPLVNIVEAVRPALIDCHLTFFHWTENDVERKTLWLYSRLVHWDSGEWIQYRVEFPALLPRSRDQQQGMRYDQQSIGATQTYAIKYAHKAMLGIPDEVEEIDSSSMHRDSPPVEEQPPVYQDSPPVQKKEKQKSSRVGFVARAKELGWGIPDIQKYMKEHYPSARSLSDLSDGELEAAFNYFSSNPPAREEESNEA